MKVWLAGENGAMQNSSDGEDSLMKRPGCGMERLHVVNQYNSSLSKGVSE